MADESNEIIPLLCTEEGGENKVTEDRFDTDCAMEPRSTVLEASNLTIEPDPVEMVYENETTQISTHTNSEDCPPWNKDVDAGLDALTNDKQSDPMKMSEVSETESNCHITYRSNITKILNDKDQPIFKVYFRDRENYNKYERALQNAIKDVFRTTDLSINVDESSNELTLSVYEAATDEVSIFQVDTSPAIADMDKVAGIPKYSTEFVEAFDEKAGLRKVQGTPNASNRLCFNCDGDHALKDCPLPRNSSRITKARQRLYTNQRYHINIDQKFGHIRAGQISDDLRKALGLRNKELPEYIYRMRILGYPPGWLEEAKIFHSGITMFDSKGRAVTESDDEEGEIDMDKVKYDEKKIISFPGFNEPLPDGFFDDSTFFNVPPVQYHQSKLAMLDSMKDNLAQAYKRKKIKLTEDESNEGSNDNEQMDNKKLLTYSLDDLKELRTKLMNESETTQTEVQEENSDFVAIHISQAENGSSNNSDKNEDLDVNNIECVGTLTPKNGISKSRFSGTPLLKQVSPFATIPSGEKWCAGVSDVINFENLPDSTGTYEKMKEVIKKVRHTVTKFNEENSND